MPPRKSIFSFIFVIWIVVAAVAFTLLCVPLLENVWAYYNWQRVPCELHFEKPDPQHPDTPRKIAGYKFDLDGFRYAASRIDFWEGNIHQDHQLIISHLNADHICYVSPSDPSNAVLNLDAHKHLDHAAKPLFHTAFIIGVAALLTVYVRRQNRRRPGSA